MKNMFKSIKGVPAKIHHRFLMLATAVAVFSMSVVPAFASSDPGFVLTSADLDPMLNSIGANIKVILPIILIVTGMFIVVTFVPRLFKKATNG